jgi:hypothetical protein
MTTTTQRHVRLLQLHEILRGAGAQRGVFLPPRDQ